MLDDANKTILLKLARATLKAYFAGETAPGCQNPLPALIEKKGAFVSLHRGKDLRGCIGQLFPDRELYRIVQHCALSAALEDNRFISVTEEELKDLIIEISVLSPFRRIRDVEEIVIGKHGLYMVRGGCRGLLLPQVAAEYNWDRVTFLEHTCMKSGLPKSAWQDPQTIIYTFEADVFSDSVNSTDTE